MKFNILAHYKHILLIKLEMYFCVCKKTKRIEGGEHMAKKDDNIYYCIGCNTTHVRRSFYTSFNPIHKNGIYPFCKNFIKKRSYSNKDEVDLKKFKEMLMQMDAPFIIEAWDAAVADDYETVGMYFKNINMRQYRGMTWSHSSATDIQIGLNEDASDDGNDNIIEEDSIIDDFKPTREMVFRWGGNYSSTEISYLEEFYQDMHITHTIVTPQHEKALILICKLQLKMDKCLESDDMVGFSKTHGEYQKLLTSSGLRPIDKIGGAEASGIRSFSQIFEEIEKDGFIKPAPIKENQDIVDKTIQYIMNYTLKLLNQQVLTDAPFDTPKVEDDGDIDG